MARILNEHSTGYWGAVVFSSTLLFFQSSSTLAQEDLSGSFLELRAAFGEYQAAADGLDLDDRPVLELLNRIDESRAVLVDSDVEVPETYAEIISGAATRLSEVARADDKDAMSSFAEALSADLKLKTGYVQSALPLAAAALEIKVQVRTLHQGDDVHGLSVAMTPLIFEKEPPLFNFPKLSSPSERLLPPGYYILYAYRDGSVVCERRAEIGTDAQRDVTIECSIP